MGVHFGVGESTLDNAKLAPQPDSVDARCIELAAIESAWRIGTMAGSTHQRNRKQRKSAAIFGAAMTAVLAALPIPADSTPTGEMPSSDLPGTHDSMPVLDAAWMRLAYSVELSSLAGYYWRPGALTAAEERAFRSIGAVVCTIGSARRSSTAFLVGTFDMAVTVAHAFERRGTWAKPEDCLYHSTDRWGQVRERIPIAYIRTQWQEDPSAFGQPSRDLAVVRLSRPSRFALRTLSFSRFAGSAAPVMLIGFRADPDFKPMKHKRSGTLFERAGGSNTPGHPRLRHDMDARGLASGAPVLDRRDGVVIGIHAKVPYAHAGRRPSVSPHGPRNAMLIMTDWLEKALRTEISEFPDADDQHVTAR